MKFQADLTWKKPLIVLAIMLLAIGQFVVAQNLGTAPQTNVAVQGQLEVLLKECDLLALVERPGLLRTGLPWVLGPGKRAETAV